MAFSDFGAIGLVVSHVLPVHQSSGLTNAPQLIISLLLDMKGHHLADPFAVPERPITPVGEEAQGPEVEILPLLHLPEGWLLARVELDELYCSTAQIAMCLRIFFRHQF